ncbi:MAG: hypothetical protein Q9164_006522 [Protoblastenia rupestris]
MLRLSRQGHDQTPMCKHVESTSIMVVDELHNLFIKIVEFGLQAENRGLNDLAQLIFIRVVYALEKCPGLYDNRKRQSLLQVAVYFQRIHEPSEAEHILHRICCFQNPPGAPTNPDPFHLLAISYTDSSEKASTALFNTWQKKAGSDRVPSNYTLSPWHRAASQGNQELVQNMIKLANTPLNTLPPQTDIINQQVLHVAASMGLLALTEECMKVGVPIDVRDGLGRTPLAVAAANGHANVCKRFLDGGADFNDRDMNHRTILEVAAHGGHWEVIQILVDRGATVNPYLADAVSTPLQAAITSPNFSMQAVQYLLDSDADVHIRRTSDGKNAVELAEMKGLIFLAEEMRLRQPLDRNQYHFPFGLG